MMISFKKLFCIAALLMVAACASPSGRGDQVASTDTALAMPASLKSSIEVGQVTGGGSWLFDPDAVRDSEFKDALKKSLAAYGVLADDKPVYRIEADISTHMSLGGLSEDRTAEETVEYHVVRLADLRIFGTTIKTTYTVPQSNAASYATTSGLAWGNKKKAAFDKITADNLAQFMQKLSTWDVGAN
jgi:hypothetical protein